MPLCRRVAYLFQLVHFVTRNVKKLSYFLMTIFNSFRVISCLILKINLNMSIKKKSCVWTYFEEDFFYQSAFFTSCKFRKQDTFYLSL